MDIKDLFNIFTSQFSMSELEKEFNEIIVLEFFGDELSALAAASTLVPDDTSDIDVNVYPLPKEESECGRIEKSTFSLFFLEESQLAIDNLSKMLKVIPLKLRRRIVCCIKGEPERREKENIRALFSNISMRKPLWYKNEKAFLDQLIKYLDKKAFSAARLYPGLRNVLSDNLIQKISRENAGISLVSSIPAEMPVIGPVAGAFAVPGETFILTANQIRLAMRVAGIYGAEMDFFLRMKELWPILAGSFGWKALSRLLVGLIPVIGPIAKSAVSFGGTYVIGTAAMRYYRDKKLLTAQEMKDLYNFAKKQFLAGFAQYQKYFGNKNKH